jgi:hypothetical protein
MILDMMTVNAGAELFTVSVKLTATKLRAMRPRRTVANLRPPMMTICLKNPTGFVAMLA